MGNIVSIVGHKGGTAKTTTTINLGAALAKYHDKKILIVDADIQCNATSMFDLSSNKYSLSDLIRENDHASVEECICGTQYVNLFLIPNIKATAALEQEIIMNFPKGSLCRLKNRFSEYVKENFDIVLIDNQASLGTFPLLSLVGSDYAICPNDTGSKFSLDGLSEVLDFVDGIKKNFNSELNPLKILLTKVRARELAHRATLQQFDMLIPKENVFKTLIPYNAAIQTAEAQRETIFKHRASVSGAKAYKELADELLNFIQD